MTMVEEVPKTREEFEKEREARRLEETRARLQPAMSLLKRDALKGVGLVDAAKLVYLSPFHFHRQFHKVFGVTPKDVTLEVQIDEAKKLLREGVASEEIARRTGFAHQSHFVSRFKQVVGKPPVRWLREEKAALAQEAAGV